MYLKDNALSNEHKQRIETRIATPRTIVDSGLTADQLAHIKSLVLAHFTEEASQKYFRIWIDNLFCAPADSGFDLSQLNILIKSYIDSYRTKDLVADLIEGIKITDFNSAANQQVFIDNAADIYLGKWTDIDVLNHLNPTTAADGTVTYHGATGVLVEHLQRQLNTPSGPAQTDTQYAHQVIQEFVVSRLKTYGIADLDAPEARLLKDYLNSQQFQDEFKNMIKNDLDNADVNDPALPMFVDKASFKTNLETTTATQLDSANVSTALARKFYEAIAIVLQNDLQPHLNNLVSTIGKDAAAALVGKDKLTLENIKTLIPGIDTFFSTHPKSFESTKFKVEYDQDRTHLVLSAHLYYPSGAPINLLRSNPTILINDDRPIVDIANEKLQALLNHMINHRFNDADLFKKVPTIPTGDWLDGNYHKISLDDFNRLTDAGLSENQWKQEVGLSKIFDYDILAKVDMTTHQILYRFILKDNAAIVSKYREKIVDLTNSQVTTEIAFLYESIQQEIQNKQAHAISSHDLFIVASNKPPITSDQKVSSWYLHTLEVMKQNGVQGLIDRLKIAYPTLVDDNRFVIEGFVSSFNPATDSTMDIRIDITDTQITLQDGSHPKVSQVYTLRVQTTDQLQNSQDATALRKALEQLAGKINSKFDSKNSPGTQTVDIGTDAASWLEAAKKLNAEVKLGSGLLGFSFYDFLTMYQEFLTKNIELQWDEHIMLDPITNTGLHGLNFHYFIKYYNNIFTGRQDDFGKVSFSHFQQLEYESATDADKQKAVDEINQEKQRLQNNLKILGKNGEALSQKLDSIAQTWITKITGDPNISKKQVEDFKRNAIDEMRKEVAANESNLEDPWITKLRAMFNGHIPENLMPIFIKHHNLFKTLVEGGTNLESIVMLATHSKFISELDNISADGVANAIKGIRSMHQNYKYTYLGLGAGLGAAGALSGGLAVSSIRANKKIKKINNTQMKMRGTKIVSALATMVSLATLASSAVFMILFFVNKGGF